jgi:hypothetical protein
LTPLGRLILALLLFLIALLFGVMNGLWMVFGWRVDCIEDLPMTMTIRDRSFALDFV